MQHSDLPGSLKEAIERKSKFYFTGVPCREGHISKRRTNSRQCCVCQRLYLDERRKAQDDNRNSIPFTEAGLLAAVEGKQGIQRIRAMIKYYEGCKLDTKDKYIKAYLDEVIDGLVEKIRGKFAAQFPHLEKMIIDETLSGQKTA